MTRELPLDEDYLRWLYSQVAPVRLRNPHRTYWSLLKLLYTKEFVWFIPNDDNRVEDGRDLRREFIEETGYRVDREWFRVGCSMLEMLIALSRRLAFEAEGQPRAWFWQLLHNINLDKCNDAYLEEVDCRQDIDLILDSVIYRQYDADGHGGLFPLQHAEKDQRKVELWYQLAAYLLQ